jgi:3-hydroxyacyl-CoA dehydrogenase
MSRPTIRKAAVLGAGIMGSRIAALLAGVDIYTYLLDIVPAEPDEQDKKKGLTRESPEFRSKLARMGIQGTQAASPPAMFIPQDAKLITPGNFEDHLEWLSDADWVIEAVAEDLAIKKELLRKVEQAMKPGAVLTTNTSGLSIKKISESLSDRTRANFLGTHFFNPPRHMKLVEIIPGPSTDGDLLAFMARFCEKRLGKSIVFAKDTPNFIANRVGAQAAVAVMKIMVDDGYTIEEVDAVTGPPMGRPKSASFRTSDMVGLDTFLKVAQNVSDSIEDPAEKGLFAPPEFVRQMVERGLLGDKTQMGFYKKVPGPTGSQILALDYNTMDYVAQRKAEFPILGELGRAPVASRLQNLAYSEDRAGLLAWKALKTMLTYCASRVPEISDDIVSVDRAMRWGYNWELGPFEIWDAIGLRKSVERMEKEGQKTPENIERMLSSGREKFYEKRDVRGYFFDLGKLDYAEIEEKAEIVLLPSLKERNKVVKSNPGGSLIDMGDGVACLEFNSMLHDSVSEVDENFEGLVIGNHGANFSPGADLKQMFPAIMERRWDELAAALREMQRATLRMKYSHKPVVAAPFRMTLAGGCEVCLAANMIRAHAECYMGLVEVGVGIVPAAGGCKELVIRATEWVPESVPSAVPGGGKPDIIAYVAKAFETIAMAKVSSCAQEAQALGFLSPYDKITMNGDHLLYDAKQSVLSLVNEGFRPPRPKDEIRVIGRTGRALLELIVYLMREGLYITDHDVVVARKLAYVLSGGDVDQNTLVTEEYLMELELEALLSLAGEEKSQARMKQMIETGRPLRN